MRRNRGWLVVAAAAALAVVVAISAGWALAGDDRSRERGVPGLDQPDGPLGLAAGDAASGAPVSPRASGVGEGQPPEGGPPGGSGAGGPDAGPGEPGDPAPGNQPPVIEDAGLSSTGLVLRIAPTVTDADGDDVSLLFDVDGDLVDPLTTCYGDPLCKADEFPSATPTKAAVRFDGTEVGYRHEASVTIIATDSRGAVARRSFAHELVADTGVYFQNLRFTVARPADCFRDTAERVLRYRLEVSGALAVEFSNTGATIREGTPERQLASGAFAVFAGQEPPALRVNLSASFAGTTTVFAAPRTYRESQDVQVPITTGDCESYLHYAIRYRIQ